MGVGLALASPGLARDSSAPADATGVEEPLLGDTSWALPGVSRLTRPVVGRPHVTGAATGGYGYTEAQPDQNGPNHRAFGTLAFGLVPVDWFGASLRLDGRYDKHPDDEEGSDDGLVGDPRILLHAGVPAGSRLQLGGEVAVWLPGSDAPSIRPEAATVDLRGLGALVTPSGTTAIVLIGFRFDNSAKAIDDPALLRVGDRISLDLSDSHAVLTGLALAQAIGKLELLGEATADLLVGTRAPDLGISPLRLTAGLRYHATERLQLYGALEASMSSRPDLTPDSALVPIEPRFAGSLGIRYRFTTDPPAPAPPRSPAPTAKPPPARAPEPPPRLPQGVADPEPVPIVLTGVVLNESAEPVPDALVRVEAASGPVEVRTAAEGQFRMELGTIGEVQVEVNAVGFDPLRQQVKVVEGDNRPLEITLRPAVPAGQLKGLIRAFSGKGVSATVRVQGQPFEAQTSEDGSFELEVPPGLYTVLIVAPGFEGQRRQVRVENRGVTVLNAELREKR